MLARIMDSLFSSRNPFVDRVTFVPRLVTTRQARYLSGVGDATLQKPV